MSESWTIVGFAFTRCYWFFQEINLVNCHFFADDCQEPLGLENRNIKDKQMTASSAWGDDQEKFGAHRARLNLDRSPQGWTASVEDRSPWLQVNLRDPFIITRIATQGYGGNIDQWVEKYRMSWKTEEGVWRNYSVPHRVSSGAVNWKTKVIIFFILKQYTTLVSNIFIHIR